MAFGGRGGRRARRDGRCLLGFAFCSGCAFFGRLVGIEAVAFWFAFFADGRRWGWGENFHRCGGFGRLFDRGSRRRFEVHFLGGLGGRGGSFFLAGGAGARASGASFFGGGFLGTGFLSGRFVVGIRVSHDS